MDSAVYSPNLLVTEDHIREKRIKVSLTLLGLQVLDLWLTFEVLRMDGVEMNPVAKLLIGLGLVIPFKIGIGVLIIWKAHQNKRSRFKWNNIAELPAYGLAWFATGIYTLVVVLNALTYLTYKGVL